MLTPDRKALFRAAYSALLLRAEPDATSQPPATPSPDEQSDPGKDSGSPAPESPGEKP
jgi:hypothetical protein